MPASGLDWSLFACLISDPEMLPFRHCARQPRDHSLSEKIGNWHAYWGTGHHYVNVRFCTCRLSNFHQHIPEPLPPKYRSVHSPRLINQVSSRFRTSLTSSLARCSSASSRSGNAYGTCAIRTILLCAARQGSPLVPCEFPFPG